MTSRTFLLNRWYVAALSTEIGSKPLARTLLGEPVVLFRDSAGAVVALEDRCVHRQAPLSLGEVVGDHLQCGYHGLTYDRRGVCIHVPSQTQIPPGACVRSYGVTEQQGFIFIWMGDPALSHTLAPYHFSAADRKGWRARHAQFHGRFDYRLLIDNLMDVTHLPFAHKSTIGAIGVVDQAEYKTERDGEHVRITRLMADIAPAPAHVEVTGHADNVDRWQVIEYTPPGFVWLQVGSAKVGKGGRDAPSGDILLDRHTVHVTTPETETTTHYFWAMANDGAALSDEQERALYARSVQAFNEDIVIIEGQQTRLDPDRPTIDVTADAGQLATRRLLERLIAEEQGQAKVKAVGD